MIGKIRKPSAEEQRVAVAVLIFSESIERIEEIKIQQSQILNQWKLNCGNSWESNFSTDTELYVTVIGWSVLFFAGKIRDTIFSFLKTFQDCRSAAGNANDIPFYCSHTWMHDVEITFFKHSSWMQHSSELSTRQIKVRCSDFHRYADDILLYITSTSHSTLSTWMQTNVLKPKCDKSDLIIIGHQNRQLHPVSIHAPSQPQSHLWQEPFIHNHQNFLFLFLCCRNLHACITCRIHDSNSIDYAPNKTLNLKNML